MNNEDKEKNFNNYNNNYYNLKNKRKEIFSKTLIARSRRYFFDINETNAGDYFLSITESKKLFLNDGRSIFKKHKIFLYKEDFEDFKKIFSEMIKFVYEKKGKDAILNKDITNDKIEKISEDSASVNDLNDVKEEGNNKASKELKKDSNNKEESVKIKDDLNLDIDKKTNTKVSDLDKDLKNKGKGKKRGDKDKEKEKKPKNKKNKKKEVKKKIKIEKK